MSKFKVIIAKEVVVEKVVDVNATNAEEAMDIVENNIEKYYSEGKDHKTEDGETYVSYILK